MSTLLQELRFGSRALLRAPMASLVTVAMLCIGIGTTAAVFTLTRTIVFQALPFDSADRLLLVEGLSALQPGQARSSMEWRQWTRGLRTIGRISLYELGEVNLTEGGAPDRVTAAAVSAEFFPSVGVSAAQGRVLSVEDYNSSTSPRLVVISHGLAMTRFGSAAGAVGSSAHLNGRAYLIVGVMPAQFSFPRRTDIWLPSAFNRSQSAFGAPGLVTTQLAQLAPGATLDAARAELSSIAREQSDSGSSEARQDVSVQQLRDSISGDARPTMALTATAVTLLLGGCYASFAMLTLGRTLTLRRDIAIRRALGASRRTILRQHMIESSLLAVTAGVAAATLAMLILQFAERTVVAEWASHRALQLGVGALLFIAGCTLLAALVGTVTATWQGTRVDLVRGVTTEGPIWPASRGGGSPNRLLTVLTIVQVSLAVTLAGSAVMVLQALARVSSVDRGFISTEVITARAALEGTRYNTRDLRATFYSTLLDRVSGVPAPARVAVAQQVPLGPTPLLGYSLGLDGTATPSPMDGPFVLYSAVSPAYFDVLRIPILSGRAFAATDQAGASRVGIVSAAAARQFWPGQSAIGRRVTISEPPRWIEIVGVVDDVRTDPLGSVAEPMLYVPVLQDPPRQFFLAARTPGSVADAYQTLTALVQRVDPDLPVYDLRLLEAVASDLTAPIRLRRTVVVSLALITLVVATLSVHALLAYWVAERRRDLGIRLALGARGATLVSLVVRRSFAAAGVGGLCGGLFTAWFTRLIATQFYGVRAVDASVLAAIAAVTILIAALGATLPAVRASRLDPTALLKG